MNYTSKRLKPFWRAIFLRAHGNTMHSSAKKSLIIMSKSKYMRHHRPRANINIMSISFMFNFMISSIICAITNATLLISTSDNHNQDHLHHHKHHRHLLQLLPSPHN